VGSESSSPGLEKAVLMDSAERSISAESALALAWSELRPFSAAERAS